MPPCEATKCKKAVPSQPCKPKEHEVEPTPKMTLAERMGYGVKGKQIVLGSER